jgi:hypothetical protein
MPLVAELRSQYKLQDAQYTVSSQSHLQNVREMREMSDQNQSSDITCKAQAKLWLCTMSRPHIRCQTMPMLRASNDIARLRVAYWSLSSLLS